MLKSEISDDVSIGENHGEPENLPDPLPENLDMKWVVVKYSEQKHAKEFVGQVLRDEGGNVTIKFIKKVKFGKFVWPDIEDIDCLHRSCVMKIFPEPQLHRRARFSFS